MLFLTQSLRAEIFNLAQEQLAGKISQAEMGERLLKLDPGSGVAHLALGKARLEAGDLEDAESLFWRGLDRKPCEYQYYLALADARRKHDPDDVLSIRLRVLGLWKLSFAEEIPDELARAFGAGSKLDYKDPETYELLAHGFESEHEDLVEPPEVTDRLLPYRLLNELQQQAPDKVEHRLIREILAEGTRCLPLFRGALREWARNQATVPAKTIALILALMGEFAGLDLLDDLLELAVFNHDVIFLHTHWAIWRIGQRYPLETLAKFRAAASSAPLALRNAMAEQITLLPEPPGTVPALLDLLKGFRGFADDPDAVHLLMVVLSGLTDLHRDADAYQVMDRYRPMLTKRNRQTFDHWIDSDEVEFLPKLVEHDINRFSIEDVCIGRALMVDEDTEDSEEESSDQEDWDDVEWDEGADRDEILEPVTATVKPGRNDPCWCGSGKKYKKCHLALDEEAERSQR